MIKENISLKPYNTFGLDYKVDKLFVLDSEDEVSEMVKAGNLKHEKFMVIGGGSNLLFIADYHGVLIHPGINGIVIEEENSDGTVVSAGAGVRWDSFVEWCVGQKLGGVENLSLIPGNAGAVPVQNIGAYGSEASNSILKVRAVSLEDGSIAEFNNSECRFGYRDSIFKCELKNKFLITKVYFGLTSSPKFNLNYAFLEAETAVIGEINLKNIRQAVINIRRRKLPDPEKTGNAGSFFKNPLVNIQKADELRFHYPLIPMYDDPLGGKKIAAGWLIEQCGWKGKKMGDAGVHDRQALVIVNYGKADGRQILELSEIIRNSVYERFGIKLEHEVEIIGST